MASLAVSNAFEARLATWQHIGACPFVDQNAVSAVPKPPYVEIEYPVAIEDRLTVGNPAIWRETGGARFIITMAINQANWKMQALGWVEELRDLMRAPFFDGFEARSASAATIDDRNKSGNKYRIPFAVTYVFYTLR
jgi:hypothetical protein